MAEHKEQPFVLLDEDHPFLAFLGIPTAALGKHQLGLLPDEVLLREVMLRARIDYFLDEAACHCIQIKPAYMASHYQFTFTVDTGTGLPASRCVDLPGLIGEIENRARGGSFPCATFLEAYDRGVLRGRGFHYNHPDNQHAASLHGIAYGTPPFEQSLKIKGYVHLSASHIHYSDRTGPLRGIACKTDIKPPGSSCG
jgi:hypothetical protein